MQRKKKKTLMCLTYLHDEIRVAHATVDSQLCQRMSAVLLHGVENGLCLETCRLESGSRHVTALRVRSDTKDCASRIVNPVRRKQAAEGRHEVVHEELDAGASNGNAALQRVHGVVLAKVEGDSGEQSVGRNDGLLAHVVEQKAAGARCRCKRSVGLVIRRPHDSWQRNLCVIDAEPVEDVLVILERLKIHKHGSRRIGRVRHVDVALSCAVELVRQPSVHRSKGENSTLVCILDLGDVLQQPEQFADRWICGERDAAPGDQLASAKATLETTHEIFRSCVCPDNGIVQSVSCCLVPDNSGLSLVCDANSLDLLARVTLALKCLHSTVNALLNRAHKLLRVMLMPSKPKC
ncbi:hypothetical protein HG530_013764 [Fusarium avenaceum]|nr:hypothetical protein HG530_013764 [Fusarium avenaceum]